MKFIDQLRAEVQIHGDMETDFRSRQYRQARDIARRYIDRIEEQARIAARSGNYERVEDKAVISGFVPIDERDFTQPIVNTERMRKFVRGRKSVTYSLDGANELFEAFLSAFRQLCDEERIVYFPLQAQILDREGKTVYHTFPFTLKKPKKEKVQAYGFPYQIIF